MLLCCVWLMVVLLSSNVLTLLILLTLLICLRPWRYCCAVRDFVNLIVHDHGATVAVLDTAAGTTTVN